MGLIAKYASVRSPLFTTGLDEFGDPVNAFTPVIQVGLYARATVGPALITAQLAGGSPYDATCCQRYMLATTYTSVSARVRF
ncbi:MAG: hypothetical protein AAF791_06155 [Bacteroidota bacterium]